MSKKWPFPGDSPVARARKMALAYRAVVEEHHPDLLKELDERFISWGERWHSPDNIVHDPDDWLPTDEAADLINISVAAISKLRLRGRITGRGRRSPDRGFEYRVRDIYALSEQVRRRDGQQSPNPSATDRVPTDGRSVSDGEPPA